MINKAPLPQEAGRGEKEAQAAKSLEALTTTPLEFTRDFEKDWRLLYDWRDRYQKAIVETPKEGRENVYREAVEFLERQNCWEYRLTTEKDSRYFVSPSGVALRIKAATGDPYFKIQPPTRLLGFATESFLDAFERVFNELQETVSYAPSGKRFYRHSGELIQCFYSDLSEKKKKQDTQLTLFGLDPQPKKGLLPIDAMHNKYFRTIEIDEEEGWVRLTHAPGDFPAIHPGNKIKKIDR